MKNKIIVLGFCALFVTSCSKNAPATAKSFSCAANEIQKEKSYYLDLEITPSCDAVQGERSSSCCQFINPINIRVAAPYCVWNTLNIGDNLLDYNLSEFLKIIDKTNIYSLMVRNKEQRQ